MDRIGAFVAGEEPDIAVPGFAYMAQGGSDASDTDPFATEPAEGDEWMAPPPHVMLILMLILPEELDQSVFTTGGHME